MLVLPCAWVRGWRDWLLRALLAVCGFGVEGRLIGFFGAKWWWVALPMQGL